MAAGTARESTCDALELSLESVSADPPCASQHEIPARPSSRLGFNSTRTHDSLLLEEHVFGKEHPEFTQGIVHTSLRSETWTSPAEPESDITTLLGEQNSHAQSFSLALDQQCTSNFILDSLQDEVPDAPSFAGHPLYEQDSEAPAALPISDSALESLLLSFSKLETPKFGSPKQHSCLPSPFSPRHTSITRSSHRYPPQRHRYLYHGYSRHSFNHLKWFWAMRESFWMEPKSRSFESKPYDGLSVFDSTPSGLHILAMSNSNPTEMQLQSPPPVPTLPPLSIHPRRGDLSALRDPYSMHIDRYFVGMPVWTMAKTLWMFDVHMATSNSKHTSRKLVADDSDPDRVEVEEEHWQSEGESIETSGSHAFSDDSDSTLVESESEGEGYSSGGARVSICDVVDDGSTSQRQRKCASAQRKDGIGLTTDSFASSIASCDGYDSDFDLPTPSQPVSIHPGKYVHHLTSPRWGATSWYRRWEILLRLCIENNPAFMGDAANTFSMASGVKTQQDVIISDDWDETLSDEVEEDERVEPDDVEYTTAKRVLVVVNGERSDIRGAVNVGLTE